MMDIFQVQTKRLKSQSTYIGFPIGMSDCACVNFDGTKSEIGVPVVEATSGVSSIGVSPESALSGIIGVSSGGVSESGDNASSGVE